MPKLKTEGTLQYVNQVTDEQADAFFAGFVSRMKRSGVMSDGFAASGIMTFPNEECCGDVEICEHRTHFHAAEDEIERLILKRIGPSLRAAFRDSAEEVLMSEPIYRAAGEIVRALPEYLLRTDQWFLEFVIACRPDLSVAGLREDQDEAEIDRRLAVQIELGEKILQLMEPEFSRVFKQMFIDAAKNAPSLS